MDIAVWKVFEMTVSIMVDDIEKSFSLLDSILGGYIILTHPTGMSQSSQSIPFIPTTRKRTPIPNIKTEVHEEYSAHVSMSS